MSTPLGACRCAYCGNYYAAIPIDECPSCGAREFCAAASSPRAVPTGGLDLSKIFGSSVVHIANPMIYTRLLS